MVRIYFRKREVAPETEILPVSIQTGNGSDETIAHIELIM